jgi:hypothetical protein
LHFLAVDFSQKISMEFHDLDEERNHEALGYFLKDHGRCVTAKTGKGKTGTLYANR